MSGFNNYYFGQEQRRTTEKEYKAAQFQFLNLLRQLNKHLEGRQYLVGDSLSIADIYVVGTLARPFRFVLWDNLSKKMKNLADYFLRLAQLPEFQQVLGVFPQQAKPVTPIFAQEQKQQQQKKK